jgi:hypothetical protein
MICYSYNISRTLYHYLSLRFILEFSIPIIPDRYYTSCFSEGEPGLLFIYRIIYPIKPKKRNSAVS